MRVGLGDFVAFIAARNILSRLSLKHGFHTLPPYATIGLMLLKSGRHLCLSRIILQTRNPAHYKDPGLLQVQASYLEHKTDSKVRELSSYYISISSKGRGQEALGYLEEMPSYGIPHNVTTYSMIIDAFCKVGLTEKAHDILSVMIHNRKKPVAVTYTALIKGYCSSGKMKNAIKVFKTMVKDNG